MHEFEAIGTQWWLERLDGGVFTDEIIQSLERYTAEFDRRYSRFRDDSLVTELLRMGELKNPPAEMVEMLKKAVEFTKITEGIFSLLVGNDLTQLGYGPCFEGSVLETKWYQFKKASIRAKPGTILDFGGMGKGWLIDEYVKILRTHGVKEFIVNGGGDIYCQSEKPVTFALEDPYDSTKKVGEVSIQNGALAASSVIKRSWQRSGEKHHHIIDPRTGKSSEGDVVASFVLADTALVADVLATVVIIQPDLENKLNDLYGAQFQLVKQQ